jgi:hypothetical protein
LDFLQKETKAAKILADGLEFFTEGNEGKEGGLHSNGTDFAWSKSDRRRKQRYLALDFGQAVILAKRNLCSLRYLLLKGLLTFE